MKENICIFLSLNLPVAHETKYKHIAYKPGQTEAAGLDAPLIVMITLLPLLRLLLV